MSMYLPVGELAVELWCDNDVVAEELDMMFGAWLTPEPTRPVVVRLETRYVDEMPSRPDLEPIFIDKRPFNVVTGEGLHDVYRPHDDLLIQYFPAGAYAHVPLQGEDGDLPVIKGCVTPDFINLRWLDDYLSIAITPILHQHDHYFMHASGVSFDGKGVLFSGETHSGKTTTCLNLLLNGWQMLSNDIVVVHPREEGVYAYPMPDMLSLRPKTFDLLPALNDVVVGKRVHQQHSQRVISVVELFDNRWSAPVRVEAICFPTICDQNENNLVSQIEAVTLARLLEGSIDCWDEDALEAHTALMTALARQADCFVLCLGRNVTTLPHLLQSSLFSV